LITIVDEIDYIFEFSNQNNEYEYCRYDSENGFKFKTVDEFLAKANKLYGDKELTTSQKLKYRID